MVIKCVVFDYGGVLMSYTRTQELYEALRVHLGIPEEKMNAEKHSLWKSMERSNDLMCGRISAEEFEQTVFKQRIEEVFGVTMDGSFHWLRKLLHPPEKIVFNDCMINLLHKLRKNGIKTGLLTNNFFIDKERKLQPTPIDRSFFDAVVESCLEGVEKPDPKIYELTHSRVLNADASAEKHEVLFLDDTDYCIQGAEKFGWRAIQVKNAEQAVAQVYKLLKEENNLDFDARDHA